MSEKLAACLFALILFAQDKPSSLTKEKEIVLEGTTSFDYVTVDSDAGRLYVGHAPKIDVIDLKKGAKIGEVDGVEGAHGAISVAEFNRGFATAGRKNRLVVFDLNTFKVSKEIETGENPDALLYVATTKEVWTFNGRGKSVTCVDASSLEVKATIKLDGKPEAAVEDAAKGIVYANLEDKSTICVLDAKKHEVTATHPLAPGEEPTGLAFDAGDGLLFAGCGNKKLVAIDAATGKVMATAPIGDRCDGVAFDAGAGIVYASCADATSVLHVKDSKTLEALASPPGSGGKTCALDAKTHKLYVTSGPRRGEKGVVKVLVFAPK